jgi:hypothetical protein
MVRVRVELSEQSSDGPTVSRGVDLPRRGDGGSICPGYELISTI